MTRRTLILFIVLLLFMEFLGCLDIALHGHAPVAMSRQPLKKVLNDQEDFP